MTSGAAAALELVSLPIRRGDNTLAKGISFTLPHGRYIELRGPNGSGKTSLLRTLAQLQPPAQPDMIVRHDCGAFYFAHLSAFRPELRVVDQLEMALEMYDVNAEPETVGAILERVGLVEQSDHKVRQLSQGQTRRLMLAVMILSGRRVWLIDEPFNALDQQAIDLFHLALKEHLDNGGAAVIATHRSLDEVLPDMAASCCGTLTLDGDDGVLQAAPDSRMRIAGAPSAMRPPVQGLRALRWVLRREFKLITARPQDIAWPSVFHWMVVSLFPFGLGTESELLARVAAGVFWVSALLATLIGAGRFFDADFEQGVLNEFKTAGLSLPMVVAGKLLSAWLFIGVPLSLASVPLGLQYGLAGNTLLVLLMSLLVGSLSLAALSCLFASLGLMARQAQIVICLMAFPVFVPLLIFGTAAVSGVQSGMGSTAPLIVLSCLGLLTMLGAPVITAQVLALAIE